MAAVETNHDISLKFVLLGHVDHGKSTLGGSILVQTGLVNERDIEKAKKDAEANGRSSWWLAYLLDEDIGERLTGKTHQYMTKEVPIGDKYYELIDVPGHQKLVTEMVEGVSRADVGILVCSARKGELEQGLRGQTFEHCVISRGMGLGKLIVAINKMDELEWSIEEYERIKSIISDKIKSLKFVNVTFVPVSAIEGENISTRKFPDIPCLFETITSTTINRNRVANNTIKVDDKFTATMVFMRLENILISRGFECIMHSGSVTTMVMVNRMAKHRFITPKQEGEPIKVEFELKTPDLELKTFFVLRLGDITIGVGRIIN
jgi:translation elongation factor EF-1alpha